MATVMATMLKSDDAVDVAKQQTFDNDVWNIQLTVLHRNRSAYEF